MKIRYQVTDRSELDLIAPLWEKLREHQRVRSVHFEQHYTNRTWTKRKTELLTAKEIYIVLAKVDRDKIVGYCVSTLNDENTGTIESIYVEPEYRKEHIGDKLIQMALTWLDDNKATSKVLTVGVGNEEVLGFYSRYNLFPKTIKLEQLR